MSSFSSIYFAIVNSIAHHSAIKGEAKNFSLFYNKEGEIFSSSWRKVYSRLRIVLDKNTLKFEAGTELYISQKLKSSFRDLETQLLDQLSTILPTIHFDTLSHFDGNHPNNLLHNFNLAEWIKNNLITSLSPLILDIQDSRMDEVFKRRDLSVLVIFKRIFNCFPQDPLSLKHIENKPFDKDLFHLILETFLSLEKIQEFKIFYRELILLFNMHFEAYLKKNDILLAERFKKLLPPVFHTLHLSNFKFVNTEGLFDFSLSDIKKLNYVEDILTFRKKEDAVLLRDTLKVIVKYKHYSLSIIHLLEEILHSKIQKAAKNIRTSLLISTCQALLCFQECSNLIQQAISENLLNETEKDNIYLLLRFSIEAHIANPEIKTHLLDLCDSKKYLSIKNEILEYLDHFYPEDPELILLFRKSQNSKEAYVKLSATKALLRREIETEKNLKIVEELLQSRTDFIVRLCLELLHEFKKDFLSDTFLKELILKHLSLESPVNSFVSSFIREKKLKSPEFILPLLKLTQNENDISKTDAALALAHHVDEIGETDFLILPETVYADFFKEWFIS